MRVLRSYSGRVHIWEAVFNKSGLECRDLPCVMQRGILRKSRWILKDNPLISSLWQVRFCATYFFCAGNFWGRTELYWTLKSTAEGSAAGSPQYSQVEACAVRFFFYYFVCLTFSAGPQPQPGVSGAQPAAPREDFSAKSTEKQRYQCVRVTTQDVSLIGRFGPSWLRPNLYQFFYFLCESRLRRQYFSILFNPFVPFLRCFQTSMRC